MLKSSIATILAAMAMIGPTSAAQAAVGPDAVACNTRSNRPAILVNITGFKTQSGMLRVQLYGSNPADFLAKGKRMRRIEVPVRGTTVPVCVAVPRAGQYAIAVRHDINGNRRSGDWSDGGGFSRNPRLSILSYKPKHRDVVIEVGNDVKPIQVIMNYRQGLSIGPARRG